MKQLIVFIFSVFLFAFPFLGCREKESLKVERSAKSSARVSDSRLKAKADWTVPNPQEKNEALARLRQLQSDWIAKYNLEEEEFPLFEWISSSRRFELKLSAGERREILKELLTEKTDSEGDYTVFLIYPLVNSWAQEDADGVLSFLREHADEYWQKELGGEVRVGQALGGQAREALLSYRTDTMRYSSTSDGVSDERGASIMELWAEDDAEAAWQFIVESELEYNYLPLAYLEGLPDGQNWSLIGEQVQSYFEGKYTSEEPLALAALRWMKEDFEEGKKWFDSLPGESREMDFKFGKLLANHYAYRAGEDDAVYPLMKNLLSNGEGDLVGGAIGYLAFGGYVAYDEELIHLCFAGDKTLPNSGLATLLIGFATSGHQIRQEEPTLKQREFYQVLRKALEGQELEGDAAAMQTKILEKDFDEFINQEPSELRKRAPVAPLPVPQN